VVSKEEPIYKNAEVKENNMKSLKINRENCVKRGYYD
jgi:hypothetical protein